MAKYRVTAPAEEDLFGIWAEIAKDNIQAADGVWDHIYGQFGTLAHSPKIGRIREEFSASLHVFPCFKSAWRRSYMIFYRIQRQRIEIIRVIESHQDITPDFFE